MENIKNVDEAVLDARREFAREHSEETSLARKLEELEWKLYLVSLLIEEIDAEYGVKFCKSSIDPQFQESETKTIAYFSIERGLEEVSKALDVPMVGNMVSPDLKSLCHGQFTYFQFGQKTEESDMGGTE